MEPNYISYTGIPWLTLITFTPLLGALVLMFLPRENKQLLRWAALAWSFVPLLCVFGAMGSFDFSQSGVIQLYEKVLWVPGLDAWYKMGMDGISLPLVTLTALLMPLCIIYSFRIEDRVKEYMVLFLLLAVGMFGTCLLYTSGRRRLAQ